MYQGHGFLQLTSDNVNEPSPIYVLVGEIGALVAHKGYTEVVLRGTNRGFYVTETREQIFKQMDEVHDKLLAMAKERFRKHNQSAVAINDPGA